jgi:hypothetical protein
MKAGPPNRQQLVVLVVGLGLTLYVLGDWLTTLGSRALNGWVAYAPLQAVNPLGGLHPWVRLVIWLLLIALWVGTSCAILRSRPSSPERD